MRSLGRGTGRWKLHTFTCVCALDSVPCSCWDVLEVYMLQRGLLCVLRLCLAYETFAFVTLS